MKEVLWAALLFFAYRSKRTAPLADMLAVKWAASYIGFVCFSETAPMLTDFVVGTWGVIAAVRHRSFRGDLMAILWLLLLPIHGLYVSAAEVGFQAQELYYWTLTGHFTLMAIVAGPWGILNVRSLLASCRRFGVGLGRLVLGAKPRARRRKAPSRVTP